MKPTDPTPPPAAVLHEQSATIAIGILRSACVDAEKRICGAFPHRWEGDSRRYPRVKVAPRTWLHYTPGVSVKLLYRAGTVRTSVGPREAQAGALILIAQGFPALWALCVERERLARSRLGGALSGLTMFLARGCRGPAATPP